MKFNILTLFPAMFESYLNESIIKRAIEKNILSVAFYDYRKFSTSKHFKVDDYQFGGGGGMVLQVEPIHKCLNSIETKGKVIAVTPSGDVLNDEIVNDLSKEEALTIICGRYEGFDERVFKYVDQEISIGDYVITGGELAAMVIVDSVGRKVDGVIKKQSHESDSFATGLLSHPVYTKPMTYDEMTVPDVLVGGHHKLIDKFRYKESIRKTLLRRRDLIAKNYTTIDKKILIEVIKELENK